MSNPESFIEEVSEEIRRDRLFALFRKYGWIGILCVLLIVGGASFREWSSTQKQKAAEELGDSILSFLEIDDAGNRSDALRSLEADSPETAALVAMLSADGLLRDGQVDEAIAELEAVAVVDDLPQVYRDLAVFKSLLARGDTMKPEELIERLEPLSQPGRAFRVLALEQKAVALVGLGRKDEAAEVLQQLFSDTESSVALRTRVFQLASVSGIEIDPFSQLVQAGQN